MKANGNSLIVPNVVKGQLWSADKVKAICKSTHLYIRALRPLIGSDLQQPVVSEHFCVPPAPTLIPLRLTSRLNGCHKQAFEATKISIFC